MKSIIANKNGDKIAAECSIQHYMRCFSCESKFMVKPLIPLYNISCAIIKTQKHVMKPPKLFYFVRFFLGSDEINNMASTQ